MTLHGLIGKTVDIGEQRYIVVEVLDAHTEQACLVLQKQQAGSDNSVIQADQWGDARRRVPATLTLPLHDEHGRIDPVFQALVDACAEDANGPG